MAASDLVSLGEVKSWLNITTTNDDAMLSTLITQISGWADGYANRTLYTNTYTLVCDGRGETRKIVPNWPITSVSSVTIDGMVIPASTDGLIPGYVFDTTLPRITLIGYRFNCGQSNVVINYTAGYSTFPNQLILAAKQLVGARYRSRSWQGKTSATGPAGQSANYYITDEATPEVLRILDSFRRVTPW